MLWNRKHIESNYDHLLMRILTAKEREIWQQQRQFPARFILQSSGASAHKNPLLIPRTHEDIEYIFHSIMAHYCAYIPSMPKRIAMIGGSSHMEAQKGFCLQGIRIEHFALSDHRSLCDFDPEVLSCYPSMVRTLCDDPRYQLRSLRGIKVGGEPFFEGDLEKIVKRFGEILVLEQYGSCEMPAFAMGAYVDGKKNGMSIDHKRYRYAVIGEQGGWSQLAICDQRFHSSFVPPDLYDTQDEVLLKEKKILAIRRHNAPENGYFQLQEYLLGHGCTNVQIDRQEKIIFYEGHCPFAFIQWDGNVYALRSGKLWRNPLSHKMPLFIEPKRSKI